MTDQDRRAELKAARQFVTERMFLPQGVARTTRGLLVALIDAKLGTLDRAAKAKAPEPPRPRPPALPVFLDSPLSGAPIKHREPQAILGRPRR